MPNYYKNGNTIFKLDLETDIVISVTNSEHSKAFTITDDAPQAATIMNQHFSESLERSARGGYAVTLSNEEEFNEYKNAFAGHIVSHSIGLF